ncbi:MAG: ATP-binding protein [Elusimicrobiota bacterium]|jgi:predicted AAA+ superfamily ATPase|nr:ATP-binding protein [Elusimicrobiota bacterium]
MIKRELSQQLEKVKTGFPVVAIIGPRQSGKTTLLKKAFAGYKYFNLEDPDILTSIQKDPGGFIKGSDGKIIIDEIQRAPLLLSYIQAVSDERKRMGDYIISGSENLLLSEKINQSLAGRAAYLHLFPLSYGELANSKQQKRDIYSQMYYGFYPAVYDREIEPVVYYNQYLSTYAERDLKQIKNIANLSHFRKFMALLAGRTGQLLNMSSLANDVGAAVSTIEGWLSVLEACYLIIRLQPYYRNFNKRQIKSSKVYFTDTALVCRLLGLTSAQELKSHYLIGHLFENFCVMEFCKHISNNLKSAKLYFFRDSNANEVDLIIDDGLRQIPVEIKLGATFNDEFLKGLDYWKKLSSSHNGYVIYTGDSEFKTAGAARVINWKNMNDIFQTMK